MDESCSDAEGLAQMSICNALKQSLSRVNIYVVNNCWIREFIALKHAFAHFARNEARGLTYRISKKQELRLTVNLKSRNNANKSWNIQIRPRRRKVRYIVETVHSNLVN